MLCRCGRCYEDGGMVVGIIWGGGFYVGVVGVI